MKVGVIGAGAIGGFYGLMLARAGHDVHFVMRSDYAAVREAGMILESVQCGDYRLDNPPIYRSPEELPPCDLLIVGAKTTSNQELAPVVGRVAGSGSSILLLQNGFGVEDDYRRFLPDDVHLLGGLCVISVHRDGPGVIKHHGLGAINIGYHSGPAMATAAEFMGSVFVQPWAVAGIELVPMKNLITARWQKLVMNMPFSGLTVLLDSGTKLLVDIEETRQLLRQIMEEVSAAAAACGHPLPEGYLEQNWHETLHRPNYISSMYLDYQQKRPLELDSIYRAPLEVARAAGCEMPAVSMLHRALVFLDQRNRSSSSKT